MGLAINRTDFTQTDYASFSRRLDRNLIAFRALLERDGFGVGPCSIGAELELYVIDKDGYANPINEQICQALGDPHLTVELNRFNLEIDFDPLPAAGAPLSHYVSEMHDMLAKLEAVAKPLGAGIVTVGILPTLREDDFGADVMTPTPRYQALTAGLTRMRGDQFALNIDGDDPLHLTTDDITLEGATTSLQLHLKVAPHDFVDTFNAAQLATPLALALGANSPILLGHRLWHETRIALFKQSIDARHFEAGTWRPPARVSFGHGWARRSVCELFEEGARLHQPILPIVTDEEPMDEVNAGRVPALQEMRLHHGTIWSWNRAVYDHHGDGHLRIEMRALPAGPTPMDMMANAALLFGLTASLRNDINTLLPAIPFQIAEYNFYRAAQCGIDATILWPTHNQSALRERPLIDVVGELLGRAADGLGELGLDNDEITHHLAVIRARIEARQTGASWQRAMFRALYDGNNRIEALQLLMRRYQQQVTSGHPVHDWDLAR